MNRISTKTSRKIRNFPRKDPHRGRTVTPQYTIPNLYWSMYCNKTQLRQWVQHCTLHHIRRLFYDQNYFTGANDEELQRNGLVFGMGDYLDEESHFFMWKTTLCSSWYTLQNYGGHRCSERQLALDGTLTILMLIVPNVSVFFFFFTKFNIYMYLSICSVYIY